MYGIYCTLTYYLTTLICIHATSSQRIRETRQEGGAGECTILVFLLHVIPEASANLPIRPFEVDCTTC